MKTYIIMIYVFSVMTYAAVLSLTDYETWQQSLLFIGAFIISWILIKLERKDDE